MLVFSPVLIPLATALLCTLAGTRPRLQKGMSLAGALALLLAGIALLRQVALHGTLILTAGNWPAPFGITFAADRLGVALVMIAALMVTIVVIWQHSDVDPAPDTASLHPLLHGVAAGACGAFLTADLFNLYVWFEVALIASLGLLALGGSLRQLDATLKYFVLNLVGTLLLLTGVALLYGATGQLNFLALGAAIAEQGDPLHLPLLGLLLTAFLVKAAAFPFFAWLPASYHTLPAPVLALFSALLSKIGICALIRLLCGVLTPAPTELLTVVGWIAVLSMVTGVLGAAYHWDMRRILAFHSISQVGYMLLAIALASPAGEAAAIFFALHHSLVKAGLFLTAALVCRHAGHYDLRRIGGLYAARPALSAMFLLLALSLVGIPPSSGFWGKYLIVKEGLRQGAYFWAGTALLVGGLTLYSMMKIWFEAFWKAHPDHGWQTPDGARLTPAYAGLALVVAVAVITGLFPEPLLNYAAAAADTLRGGGR